MLGITLGDAQSVTVKLRVNQKFTVHEWDIHREGAGPLELMEKSCSIDGLGNQDYNLSAICEENAAEVAHAHSTFGVDVQVEIYSVEEESEEEAKARRGSLAIFSDQDEAALDLGVCEDLGLQRRSRPARIYDCFPFLNELALLQVTAMNTLCAVCM